MIDLINILLANISSAAFSAFDSVVQTILENTLYIERFLDGVLTGQAMSQLYVFIYSFACMLMALKFLQRGYMIYILWRDGDPDSSPKEMVMGVVLGVMLMVTFPIMYDWFIEVLMWLYSNVLSIFQLSNITFAVSALLNIASGNIFLLLVCLIYAIAGFLLWLQTIKRGIELLILRIGFPIACVGLVNSDGGMFRTYLSTIIKIAVTLMLQAILMSMSFRLVNTLTVNGIMLGIATLMTANSVPALFQSFLITGGGGANIGHKIHTTTQVIQSVRGLIK